MSTTRIFGREAELAQAGATLDDVAAGTPQILLVGGDAGIGKTSLVRSVADTAAARGFTVLEGHCLDIDAAVPFAPVVEALRPIASAAADDASRPAARRLAALLDQANPPTESASALDDLRQVVAEVAASGPVMLLLEDMHWSDRSTRDLATSVARTVRGRLLLVLTFRSDDLTRRHPFRKVLAELTRDVAAERIDLGPLDRPALAEMVAQRTGGRADPSIVGNILARSEGNPLYAEELLAGDTPSLSASLTDLLLTRVDALAPRTRDLLRIASVSGTRIDTPLLLQVADVDEDAMEADLREAMEANVVVNQGDDLAFRHGLLREAVYDDLLPGERSRVHARCAIALQEQLAGGSVRSGPGSLGQLAYHFYAAHDLPSALTASVRAGLAAKTYGAPEAGAHLERALELWDQVPDAQERSGRAKADVVRLLGEVAESQGDKDRQHALAQQAVALLEPDGDRLLASRVYTAMAAACQAFGDLDAHQEAVHRALEYARGEPSEELAAALVITSMDHDRHARWIEAAAAAREAADVARRCGSPLEEVRALGTLAHCEAMLGNLPANLATKGRAIRVARASGQRGHELLQTADLAWFLVMSGDVERGIEVARTGYEDALADGLQMSAIFCLEQVMEATRWKGGLDEADLMLTQMLDMGLPPHRWRWLRAWALIGRGQPEAALELERETLAMMDDAVGLPDPDHIERQVEIFVALGDVSGALRLADAFVTSIEDTDSPIEHATTALLAYRALNAAAEAGVAVPVGLEQRAARHLTAAKNAMNDGWSNSYPGGNVLHASALAARLAGGPSVEQWHAAVEAEARFGAFYVLEARLGLAGALLTEGERDEGRELLVDIWQSARQMGAMYVADRARRLATRARVPLPDDDAAAGPLTRLTAREREVLELLATGCTNRAIAESLVISEKTVSVHVSNILSKLACANRGEAAALARELVSG